MSKPKVRVCGTCHILKMLHANSTGQCVDCYNKSMFPTERLPLAKIKASPLLAFRALLRDKLSVIESAGKKTPRKQNVDLTIEFLMEMLSQQECKCAFSGIEMSATSKNWKCISIDRIDSNKPYARDNVQLICSRFNKMKSNLSDEDFREFCRLVINTE